MKNVKKLILLLSLFALPMLVLAQDEASDTEDETELPSIPYFQSYAFNVPVLVDWDNQSTANVAEFVDVDLQSSIRVETVPISLARDGIEEALNARFDNLPTSPDFVNTVNLADGEWVQEVYHLESGETISALGNARNDQTYVITFVETDADTDTYHMIVREPDNDTLTPEDTITQAYETLFGDGDVAVEFQQDVNLPSGEWREYLVADDVTALTFRFGSAWYVTLSSDVDNASEFADAFNTVHLGFFTTPDNSNYMFLGVFVTVAIFLILFASMWSRWGGARRDLQTIAMLQESD